MYSHYIKDPSKFLKHALISEIKSHTRSKSSCQFRDDYCGSAFKLQVSEHVPKDLQDQFISDSKNDSEVKKYLDKVMKYNNYSDCDPYKSSTRLNNNMMQGYLKKHAKEEKLFQKLYHKRFVQIDFNTATMVIKYSHDDSEGKDTNR